jgi:hypothetical protein
MQEKVAKNIFGFYVKPKQQSEFKNKWVGPIQMCNLGFITNVQAVLKDTQTKNIELKI